jgi:hypothetical protein
MSHRLADVFAEPDTYRPDRYLTDPAAARSPVGFGGAPPPLPRRALRLPGDEGRAGPAVQQFDVALIDRDPRPEPGQRLKWPQSPCRVAYHKRPA